MLSQSLRDDDKEANATLRLAVRKLELVRDLVDRTEESLQHRRDRIRSLREALNSGNTVDVRDLGSDWEGDDGDDNSDGDSSKGGDDDDDESHDDDHGEEDSNEGDDVADFEYVSRCSCVAVCLITRTHARATCCALALV
jgi:hypothetical protein